jgi:hypothetical protein
MHTASETEKALTLSGFTCNKKSVGPCPYSECLGTVPGYSKPVLITIPVMASTFRIHFHGHKLGTYTEYEKDLPSMVKSFGLNESLCAGQQITIFPESDGRCDTYKKDLNSREKFQFFFKNLHNVTGGNLKSLPMHISAHSGGGRPVMDLLNAGFPVEQVTIFDGTYSDEQKDSLVNWYKKGQGKLILATVKSNNEHYPDAYTKKIIKDLGLQTKDSKRIIKGRNYDVAESSRFIHYTRTVNTSDRTDNKPHYDVQTETWPGSY